MERMVALCRPYRKERVICTENCIWFIMTGGLASIDCQYVVLERYVRINSQWPFVTRLSFSYSFLKRLLTN